MRVRYDLHIHSGLSPCADKDMTPVNIVASAKLLGIDMIAVSDHNSIRNVEVALKAGEFYGVTVVPAFELQTEEEIHVLCLFRSFAELSAFYDTVEFVKVENRADIFGEQLVFDEDDNVTDREKYLLLTSSTLPVSVVAERVAAFGGIAVPAHVDREANGMVQILGAVTDEFFAVEFSDKATPEQIEKYAHGRAIIIDSDAHTLDGIKGKGVAELSDCSVDALFSYLGAN